MAELTLILSKKCTKDFEAQLRNVLERHLKIGKTEPTDMPIVDGWWVIELAGIAAAWKVLVKPAEAFLSLLKHVWVEAAPVRCLRSRGTASR